MVTVGVVLFIKNQTVYKGGLFLKVNIQFWKSRGGSSFVQDAKVRTLRKMGFKGTLNDMLRGFYRNLTGIDDLTTAQVRAENVPDKSGIINFVGKSNGDGNYGLIIRYGVNAAEMSRTAFTSEVNSGYLGVSTEGGTIGFYETTNPSGAYVQFCFYMDLTPVGTREELLKKVKSMKVRVKTQNSTVKVWNPAKSAYDNAKAQQTGAGFKFVEIELLDNLNELLGDDNKIVFLVRTNAKTTGTAPLRLEVDYAEIAYTFFK